MAMAREAALPVHDPPYDVPIVSLPGADPEPYGGGPRPLTLVVVSRAGDTLADRAHTERKRVSTRDSIGYDAVSEPGWDPDQRLLQPSCGGRPLSGVIVIMEAFGLVDHIKDVARRFAEQGYLALAPDRYTREGSPDPSQLDSVLQTMFSVPDPQAVADLEGALAYLKRRPDANGKVGAIGFCAGGRYTLILACQSTDLDAAVDSAGGFIIQDQHTPQRPVSPIDMIPTLSCPFLAHFGEEDPNPSPAYAARLQEDLEKHGKTYELRMYRHAGHAFFADYRPSYRAVAAQDMWHRVLVFYKRYLQA